MSTEFSMRVEPTKVTVDLSPPLAKAAQRLAPVGHDRPRCRMVQRKLKRAVNSFFAGVRPRITEQVVALLAKHGIQKDADTDQVDDIMGVVDLTVFNNLPKAVKPILEDMYSDAGTEALRTVMVAVNASKGVAPELEEGAWDQVDEGAGEYASIRAAEMVGMRYDKETGKLVPNPDAKWAISDETRAGIRSLVTQAVQGKLSVIDLPDKLRDAYAFSSARADMIARTEMKLANGQGALGGLVAAGNVSQKVWITMEDDKVSDDCQENADAGPIDLQDDFPSGDQTEPAHPSCRCSVAGHVDWGVNAEE